MLDDVGLEAASGPMNEPRFENYVTYNRKAIGHYEVIVGTKVVGEVRTMLYAGRWTWRIVGSRCAGRRGNGFRTRSDAVLALCGGQPQAAETVRRAS